MPGKKGMLSKDDPTPSYGATANPTRTFPSQPPPVHVKADEFSDYTSVNHKTPADQLDQRRRSSSVGRGGPRPSLSPSEDSTKTRAEQDANHSICPEHENLTVYIALSCIVLIINPVFGLVAFIIAVLGKRKKAANDLDRANSYAKISCHLSVAGILVSAVAACVGLTFLVATSQGRLNDSAVESQRLNDSTAE